MTELEKMIQELRQKNVQIDRILPIFLEDEEYYVETLKSFLEENEITQLQQCILQKNYEAAMNHAMNVKALTGTLGLTSAYQSAQSICLSLHRHSYATLDREVKQIADCCQSLCLLLHLSPPSL